MEQYKEMKNEQVKFGKNLPFNFIFMNIHNFYDVKQNNTCINTQIQSYIDKYFQKTQKQNDLQHDTFILIQKKTQENIKYHLLEKEQNLYKGVRYFYTDQQESAFDDQIQYFGDKYIANIYAQRYNGSIQAYIVKKDLKLFKVQNDNNMRYIYKILKKKIDKGNYNSIFFDDISYGKFKLFLQIKYGVDINKYFQAYMVSKYTNYDTIWLYQKDPDIQYEKDEEYTGYHFSAGYLDRICAKGLKILLEKEYDGITQNQFYYSPFCPIGESQYSKQTQQYTEITLFNKKHVLQRNISDILDSMQYIKSLDFDPFQINFDINYSRKNDNYQIIKFYLKQQELMNLEQEKIKDRLNRPIDDRFKIMTYNVHNFKSINMNDGENDILTYLFQIMQINKVQIAFIQEFYRELIGVNINQFLKKYEYKMYKSDEYTGLVIFYSQYINVKYLFSQKLINDIKLDQRRFSLYVSYNGYVFCNTHLEVGQSIFNRKGHEISNEEQEKIKQKNTIIRKQQIDQILTSTKVNFLVGDFNFNKNDEEFDKMTQDNGFQTVCFSETTPFKGVQTDFIFSLNKQISSYTIPNKYSDHIPVISTIQVQQEQQLELKQMCKEYLLYNMNNDFDSNNIIYILDLFGTQWRNKNDMKFYNKKSIDRIMMTELIDHFFNQCDNEKLQEYSKKHGIKETFYFIQDGYLGQDIDQRVLNILKQKFGSKLSEYDILQRRNFNIKDDFNIKVSKEMKNLNDIISNEKFKGKLIIWMIRWFDEFQYVTYGIVKKLFKNIQIIDYDIGFGRIYQFLVCDGYEQNENQMSFEQLSSYQIKDFQIQQAINRNCIGIIKRILQIYKILSEMQSYKQFHDFIHG